MDTNLKGFSEWYKEYQESGAMRRAKRDAFERGTMPPLAPANVHSGNTGSPFAVVMAARVKTHADKKKRKPAAKKKAKGSKKKGR